MKMKIATIKSIVVCCYYSSPTENIIKRSKFNKKMFKKKMKFSYLTVNAANNKDERNSLSLLPWSCQPVCEDSNGMRKIRNHITCNFVSTQ